MHSEFPGPVAELPRAEAMEQSEALSIQASGVARAVQLTRSAGALLRSAHHEGSHLQKTSPVAQQLRR